MTVEVWIEKFVKQVKSEVVKGNNKYNGLIKFELFYINASWVCYWVNLEPCFYYAVRATDFGLEGELSWVSQYLNGISLLLIWVNTGGSVIGG